MQSNRINNISISPTINIAAKVADMKRDNIDLIELNVGEPDLPTPDHIKQAAQKALDANLTKYTVNRGLLDLRQAISERFKADYQVEYDVDELIISNGAKQCLYNVIMTVLNKNDEVIIPGPYYPSYTEMVKLAEGVPIHLMAHEDNGFKLQPEELESAITDRTRVFILCNPSNPTGIVYSKDELVNLAYVLKGKNVLVICDEVYSKLLYDKTEFTSIAAISDEMREKSVVVSGVSKSYAMTGWRIGFAAGDKKIIEGANMIQSHSTSGACSISQHAALEAISGPQESVTDMLHIYAKRRDSIYKRVIDISGVNCVKPMGAFYAFPNISKFFHQNNLKIVLNNSEDLTRYLLDKTRVAVVPGSAFGSDDHIRISYSNSLENIEEGMRRISEALSDLLP
jgi:aspartate aminotransferase